MLAACSLERAAEYKKDLLRGSQNRRAKITTTLPFPFSSLPSNLRPANWHRVRSDVRRPTSPPPTTAHQLTLPSSFLPSLSTQPSDPQSRRLFFPGRPICSFAHFALLNTGLFTPSRPLHDVLSRLFPQLRITHSSIPPSTIRVRDCVRHTFLQSTVVPNC